MTVKIADDYVALNARLNQLEMERAKQLADKLNEPEDKQQSSNCYESSLGYFARDFDPA